MKTVKILVVDDQAIIAEDLIMKVAEMGYSGVAVSSGKEALQQITLNFKPDLILMDVTLKDGESGIQAARDIQEYDQIPILFVTARSASVVLGQIGGLVHTGYIQKPFCKNDLQLGIRKLLATA